MLGLYHAELARILHVQCADIGELANAQVVLSKNTEEWLEAEKIIKLYEGLFYLHNGNETLMNNWLRKKHQQLNGVSLYLMVNELGIDKVLSELRP